MSFFLLLSDSDRCFYCWIKVWDLLLTFWEFCSVKWKLFFGWEMWDLFGQFFGIIEISIIWKSVIFTLKFSIFLKSSHIPFPVTQFPTRYQKASLTTIKNKTFKIPSKYLFKRIRKFELLRGEYKEKMYPRPPLNHSENENQDRKTEEIPSSHFIFWNKFK